jgi:hypothetical protein
MAALTVSLIVVFSLFGAAYAYFSLVKKPAAPSRAGRVLLHGGFALATVLLGISFITHYPYTRYNFLHIMIYLWCAWAGVILAFYFKTEKQKKVVSLLFAALYRFFILLKFTFTDRNFYLRLPLNICNIALVIIVLRVFVTSRMLDNYALTLGFLGAVMNFFMGAWHNGSYNTAIVIPGELGFYYIQVIEATLVHSFFLTFCVYALLAGMIIPDVKEMAKNFIWIVPVFAVFVFTNQLYDGDFFFTGTLRDTPPLLIALYRAMPLVFTVTIGGRPFEINILDNLIVIILSFSVLTAASWGLVKAGGMLEGI